MVARTASTDNIWRWVDHVLALIHRSGDLSERVGGFELSRDADVDSDQRQRFNAAVIGALATDATLATIPASIVGVVLDRVYDELLGISVLGPLWRDEDVTEILVDGWDAIRIERDGRISATGLSFRDADHAGRVARDLAAKISDRSLSATQPVVTAELPRARVTLMIGRIVKSNLAIAIRKFRPLMGMSGLLDRRTLTSEMAEFLADCVRCKANILVAGGTGCGKTTFVNALSESIPTHERVITIEDAYELSLHVDNCVALQSVVKASADDDVNVDLARLLVESLRMRPDRIIVGEIRDANAAAVMLEAANTGHDGTMTTVHASSVERAINFRLANWIRAGTNLAADIAIAEIVGAFDVVVQIERSARTGDRYVTDIATVDDNTTSTGTATPIPLWRATTAAVTAEGDSGVAGRRVDHHRVDHHRVDHHRVGAVAAGSDLANKLAGGGVTRWCQPSSTVSLT